MRRNNDAKQILNILINKILQKNLINSWNYGLKFYKYAYFITKHTLKSGKLNQQLSDNVIFQNNN